MFVYNIVHVCMYLNLNFTFLEIRIINYSNELSALNNPVFSLSYPDFNEPFFSIFLLILLLLVFLLLLLYLFLRLLIIIGFPMRVETRINFARRHKYINKIRFSYFDVFTK
uniref:Uncharacterized protein n=1 Tax=Cacopsylla melanoneura TaxID=428564 RepID=A0A8D8RD79_9HEMI